MKKMIMDSESVDYTTQTWVALEIEFQSVLIYEQPVYDVDFYVIFTSPERQEIKMPGFWDGGKTWKVRFAPTCNGVWKFKSFCTDKSNTGLNGKKGKVGVKPYQGDKEIYKRGFIKTEPGVRYLMYNDGTPFFYLGDTHWSMCKEPYEYMFAYLVDKRVAQGFTAYQSEPIEAKYKLSDGLSENDIAGFQDMDKRFKYIADAGLVHSNAQLFFTNELQDNMFSSKYSDDDLIRLARYWVARYAAYPVMWTTAQEADDDFHEKLDISNNRWKIVFNAVHQNDPYHHPQSAHQEGDHKTSAHNSQFKDLPGYSWFAAQTHTNKNGKISHAGFKDFWYNSGRRPVVAYESHYESLWTNEFGARQQGWVFFLSGMCGYGYGAQDIWLYDSIYDKHQDTVIGDITITKEMKNVTWKTSGNYATPAQLAIYMKGFFESFEWWRLEPCFDDPNGQYVEMNDSFYTAAIIGNQTYVIYFYNKTQDTGGICGLEQGRTYSAKWFNPRSGEYTAIAADISGTGNKSIWLLPDKPDENDWVVYITKNA